jgi:HSP20 family protein
MQIATNHIRRYTMTSMIRFNPGADFRRMQREIDRVFENFLPIREENGAEPTVWAPRVDLIENENDYVVHADLPGVAREDIKISFQDGTLVVSGERRMENTEEKGDFVRVERSFGHFYRSFALPQMVDVERIKASFTDGVLTIRAPKAEETKPRQIELS